MAESTSITDAACCLEEETGLYRFWHFKSVLTQELARLDRWERPLSLALIDAPGLRGADWASLGEILRFSLRRIDLAARVSKDQAAVIMPDADEHRARRWLAEVIADLEKARFGPGLRYGLALARPWEGHTVGDLMRAAADNFGANPLENTEDGDDCEDYCGTAIAAEERNLLFAGFQALEASPRR